MQELDTGGKKSTKDTQDSGPWGKEWQESVLPFDSGEKQSSGASENGEEDKAESDDYYTFEGVEYRNIDKIDISTDQGKFEWLDGLIGNASARLEHEYHDIIGGAGFPLDTREEELEDFFKHDATYQDNKRESDIVRRQSKILKNLDINGEGGVLGAIERRRNGFAEIMNDPNASSEARETAYHDWEAAQDLHSKLSIEMARRDPNYFGQNEMQVILDSEIAASERRVEQSMLDAYFGEDGFIHKAPNGEKIPSAATEDAKIDLRNARQDAETFGMLMDNYQSANNYMAPQAIKKKDFAPTIDKFIEDHTSQINQLILESKGLTKGTPKYAENEAKRKQLARERSSARRLKTRFFNVVSEAKEPAGETNFDDRTRMGETPASETEAWEQEESPTSYHFEAGFDGRDITVTVGQEIPGEWFEPRIYEDSTDSGFGLKITRPPLIEDYLRQALDIEFGKLSENERRHYDYPALFGAVMTEAKKTKKIPDIVSIMNRQRGVNE